MKIVWTEPAVEDLRELHAYIARDSELYASEFIDRIISAAQRLADHPHVGRIVRRQMIKIFGSFSTEATGSFIE